MSVRGQVRPDAIAVLVAGAIAAGIALRVWVLLSSQGALDADEAVWGLMAQHVLHGEVPTFFWGQAYGGTQETLVTAGLFRVFGRSKLALELVPILFWAVACVLLWRVGRRTLGEPRARLAAALFWMWPVYVVWKSTRAHGFYGAGLVFGLWSMLAALRLDERVTRAELVSLGLALGLGWWATPQIAILGLPAVAWLVWRRPALLRRAPLAAVAFALGSLPWWLYNLRHGWPSLHAAPDPTTPLDHLHNLAVSTLPAGLGLRVPFTLRWLGGAGVGLTLYAACALGFVWLLVRRPRGLGLPLLAALLFPLLYAASPYSWLNSEPRYLTLLAPVLALLVAAAATSHARAAAIVAVAAALSATGLALMVHENAAAPRENGAAVPADVGPLLRTLDRYGVNRVWTSYWIAYRVAFSSGERVIAAQLGSDRFAVRGGRVVQVGGEAAHPGTDGRYEPYQLAVATAPSPAYVFATAGTLAPRVRGVFRRARYRLVRSGGFDVWLPPG